MMSLPTEKSVDTADRRKELITFNGEAEKMVDGDSSAYICCGNCRRRMDR